VNAHEQDATQAREDSYQEVSLRAVELLAKAQRAADEAVAEAQSYARDLEQSARDQYKQILERAQIAAQQLAPAEGSASGAGQQAAGGETGALDAQKLTYVRTYARVAHAQLKSVLAALNDELDQLAAMAEGDTGPAGNTGAGAAQGPGPVDPWSVPDRAAGHKTPAPDQGPAALPSIADAPQRARENDGSGAPASGAQEWTRSGDDGSWPPIFAATNAISYLYKGSSSDGHR
jgi:hypothetical protein